MPRVMTDEYSGPPPGWSPVAPMVHRPPWPRLSITNTG